jgi:hypothetical protein
MNTQVGFTKRLRTTAGGLALGIVGLFAGSGVASADRVPPVTDEDGRPPYDTSSYPAQPTWPAASTYPAPSTYPADSTYPAPSSYPADSTYPAPSTWPGQSSHPCCSR